MNPSTSKTEGPQALEPLLKRLQPLADVIAIFAGAFLFIALLEPLTQGDLLLGQLLLWVANVFMLLMVWLSLRFRGESLANLGLTFETIGLREGIKAVGLSILVFLAALLAFALGSILMVNITGLPEQADMSGYDYFKGNPFIFALSWAGVLFVSSFGEEVIYRGFLIHRMSQVGNNSRFSQALAVLISAVVFGFVHYGWGPMGVVQTTFMGLALGASFLFLRRRLWILVLAHAYMDTILFVQLYLES